MASSKDLKKRGQAWLTYGALLFVGILVGHAVPGSSATPDTVTGVVTKVTAGSATTALTFEVKPTGGKPTKYELRNPVSWQEQAGTTWKTTGVPPCLAAGAIGTASATPGTKPGRPITIGVISVPPVNGLQPQRDVVWVKCEG